MPLPSARSLGVPGVLVGLGAVVGGGFLPWLQSGATTRNSFAAARLVRDVDVPSRALGVALAAWPFIAVACTLCGVLTLLRLPRAAAGVAVLIGGWTLGLVALVVSRTHRTGLVHLDLAGPAVTAAGAVLLLAGALIAVRRSTTRVLVSAVVADPVRTSDHTRYRDQQLLHSGRNA